MALFRNLSYAAPWALTIMLLLISIMAVQVTMSEAAKIETFNAAKCEGSPTNTFYVGGNTCQKFNDQSAVLVTDVSDSTRVSVHNAKNWEGSSSVAQFYGPHCSVAADTGTKLRAVWIQG